MPNREVSLRNRPVIFESRSIPEFIAEMLAWRKTSDPKFSIRKTTKDLGCSPSLVTQVSLGKRQLTRERVGTFCAILKLSRQEATFLDRWVANNRAPTSPAYNKKDYNNYSSAGRRPQNHLLTDWLNVYIKDSCELKAFEPKPEKIYRQLGGIASEKHIERSLKFLIKEGFIRKTLDGRWVKNDSLITTTDGISNVKIRKFHKRALQIATRAIDLFPPEKRRASAVVISMNESSLEELVELLKEFYEKILHFSEQHATENERLYQVLINLTPIGGLHEE